MADDVSIDKTISLLTERIKPGYLFHLASALYMLNFYVLYMFNFYASE